MPSLDASYPALRDALIERYGLPPSEEGGDDPFAAILAAFLGRTLDPARVGRAIAAMRDAGLLDAATLAEADPSEIVEAVRASGSKPTVKTVSPLRKIA